MNEITVRPMTPEDWSAVAKIYLEVKARPRYIIEESL